MHIGQIDMHFSHHIVAVHISQDRMMFLPHRVLSCRKNWVDVGLCGSLCTFCHSPICLSRCCTRDWSLAVPVPAYGDPTKCAGGALAKVLSACHRRGNIRRN